MSTTFKVSTPAGSLCFDNWIFAVDAYFDYVKMAYLEKKPNPYAILYVYEANGLSRPVLFYPYQVSPGGTPTTILNMQEIYKHLDDELAVITPRTLRRYQDIFDISARTVLKYRKYRTISRQEAYRLDSTPIREITL